MFQKEFHIKLFKPGMTVYHKDQRKVVDHVVVNGYNLYVFFTDGTKTSSEEVHCEPTLVRMER